MLAHYLTTALRHFRKHRLTTAINVVGMALGLTCFVCSWGVSAYFGQMDQFHSRAARTYFVANEVISPKVTMPATPWLLAEYLRTDFRELELVARATSARSVPFNVAGNSTYLTVAYADPEFLRVFDLPFVIGNRLTALDSPRSAVVSRATAQRLFGTENVVGRTLRFAGREDTVVITGVVAPLDLPSHVSVDGRGGPLGVDFEVLVSMQTQVDLLRSLTPDVASRTLDRWVANSFFTYVVLRPGSSLTPAALEAQLDAFKDRHVANVQERERHFRVRPITHFTLTGVDALTGADRTGLSSTTIVRMLGVLVLLVSCLNYANIATAQVSARAAEVALRKVIGATRRELALQYIFEGALLTTTALLVTLALVGGALSAIGAQTVLNFGGLILRAPAVWLGMCALIATVTLVAGLYPALVLSRAAPATALRGARSKGHSRVAAATLIGVQFGAASFLTIAVLVMIAQNREMRHAVAAPGEDPVLVITNDARTASVNPALLRARLQTTRGVLSVSGVQRIPWGVGGAAENIARANDASAARVLAQQNVVDLDFFQTMHIPFVAGRPFERDRADDVADLGRWLRADAATARDFNVVINAELTKAMGFETPADAVGATIYHPTGNGAPQPMRIVGVVGESNLRPMTFGLTSDFYLLNPEASTITVLRLSRSDLPATLAAIDVAWQTFAPDVPLLRRFADEQFEQSYSFLNALNAAFAFLACLASAIAVIGLVGMTLHLIERRTHEIAVRKTLGASTQQMLWLLFRGFAKPIVAANVIVWPLAFGAMRAYLGMFDHSFGLSWTPFAVSLGGTLLVAWLAVGGQVVRAARMSPVKVLRYE